MDFFLAKRLPAGMENVNQFGAAYSRNCTRHASRLSTIRVRGGNFEN